MPGSGRGARQDNDFPASRHNRYKLT